MSTTLVKIQDRLLMKAKAISDTTNTQAVVVVRRALEQYVARAYEPDDGPLTDAEIEAIRRAVPQMKGKPARALFPL